MSDRVLNRRWNCTRWSDLAAVILFFEPNESEKSFRVHYFLSSELFPPPLLFFPPPSGSRTTEILTLPRIEAPYGVMCLRLIECFDQKTCLIYIEMIPLLVEKIRINWFPWDSWWKSFDAVQSREWKMSQKLLLKRPGNVLFE